jgi:hypothetical protein
VTGGPLFTAPPVVGHLPPIVPGVAPAAYRGVVGTVTKTPCDAACYYAVGHECNCSCGGKNHGRGHHSIGSLFGGR